MRDTKAQSLQKPSLAVRAEAAAWIARWHGPARSPELKAGLQRWLAEDPQHARAFECMTEAWEAATNVSAVQFSRTQIGKRALPPRGLARAAIILLAVGALALGIYGWLSDPSYATRVGEQRTIRLEDGSRVSLNSATRIVVSYRDSQRRVRLDEGEAFFEVAHNPQRPFIVSVGDQQVAALGTSFSVRYEHDRLAVVLVEGKVAVSDVPSAALGRRSSADDARAPDVPRRIALTLAPGQRLTLAATAPPELDTPRIEAVTAWRRGEVILEKTPLADAIAEMNRYDEARLVIDDPDVAGLLVSGIYRTGDSAGFAQAVARMYRLSVIRQDDRIHLGNGAQTQ